jgi:hypothetical protein
VVIPVKKKEAEKIYIQMSSHIDDVTGFVMTANFNVTSTMFDASSCRYSLYVRVTVRLDGRVRQQSVTHNARVHTVVNKPNSDL